MSPDSTPGNLYRFSPPDPEISALFHKSENPAYLSFEAPLGWQKDLTRLVSV